MILTVGELQLGRQSHMKIMKIFLLTVHQTLNVKKQQQL